MASPFQRLIPYALSLAAAWGCMALAAAPSAEKPRVFGLRALLKSMALSDSFYTAAPPEKPSVNESTKVVKN